MVPAPGRATYGWAWPADRSRWGRERCRCWARSRSKPSIVHADACLGSDLAGEFDGQAIGVVQVEGHLGRDPVGVLGELGVDRAVALDDQRGWQPAAPSHRRCRRRQGRPGSAPAPCRCRRWPGPAPAAGRHGVGRSGTPCSRPPRTIRSHSCRAGTRPHPAGRRRRWCRPRPRCRGRRDPQAPAATSCAPRPGRRSARPGSPASASYRPTPHRRGWPGCRRRR
jgi:hypothetical protein